MRKSDTLFFLTGAAALVYETVWIRLLARLLGSDAGGLAVVFAVFMGGMGLGALCFGGWARRARRPAHLFAYLEGGLALWAAMSPFVLGLLDPLGNSTTRITLAVLFLLPPTMAMGASFPLMGRLTIRAAGETGSETSAFYGANTLGAACGALLGPLVLMPMLGLSQALLCAALLDILAAYLAIHWLAGRKREERQPTADGLPMIHPMLAATFLVGLCGLGLEVVLARLLVTITGSSVYAYAIVLFVFLAGIGLGSRQLVRREASAQGGRGLRADLRTFQLAALALPTLALGGLFLLRWQLGEATLFGALTNRMPAGTGVLRLWASHALFAALALLPPALALGAALPSIAAAFAERFPKAGRESALARIYAFNTAGSLCGSLVAGFVLLPWLGPEFALYPLLLAGLLAGLLPAPRSAKRVVLALAGFGLGVLLVRGEGTQREGLLFLRHDSQATVCVEEGDDAMRSLRVNGKVVATTAPVDLRLQRLLGHVPGLLHTRVQRALVIGLGTGMTAGSLLDLPTLEHLDIFEISPSMRDGARQFSAWNGAVVDDPRTSIRVADGRYTLAVSDERWDLITSDPIHPWTRGSSDLYSLEHFESMAAHLAPGGVASQWLPLYQLSTEDVQTVIATWCAAFPHTSAWLTAYDLALVGSAQPLAGEAQLHTISLPPELAAHLSEAGVHSAPELAALAVAGDGELRDYVYGVVPMRDDKPVLEFRAPFSYLGGYSTEVLAWAGRDAFVDGLPSASRGRAREVRAILRTFIEELPGGWTRAAKAYGEELLSLPPL